MATGVGRDYISDEEAAIYAEAARLGQNDLWGLSSNEKLWVQYQPYLLTRGYQLRPRYRPGWVRSWQGTNRNPRVCEDSLTLEFFKIMDAVRVSDGKRIIIKALDTHVTPSELPVLQYLSSHKLISNPRNHCTFALDSFPIPGREGWVFVIMETYHSIHATPFTTIGEVLELSQQLLEGLVFMHEHNLAHRDCASANIMMKADTLFKDTPHPHPSYAYLTEDRRRMVEVLPRRGHEVKYFFIDFGLATLFATPEERTLVTGADGRERDVPELSTPHIPYDPFKVDIWIIGRFLWKDFYEKSNRSLHFLEPLLKRMTEVNPSLRPTALEAFGEFELIREVLEPRTLTRALNPNLLQRTAYSLSDIFYWAISWLKHSALRQQPQSISLP
ncbi:unnamed protein product [Rhizoctonia solani]|uniref:Protein kinase domain-containing protein n=1 Tax=Rhizoctonia solani TaxID=456999 RepID=A0A8H3DV19_9AGAM|nr:unnamed protein product [Rhizoctonia solani]